MKNIASKGLGVQFTVQGVIGCDCPKLLSGFTAIIVGKCGVPALCVPSHWANDIGAEFQRCSSHLDGNLTTSKQISASLMSWVRRLRFYNSPKEKFWDLNYIVINHQMLVFLHELMWNLIYILQRWFHTDCKINWGHKWEMISHDMNVLSLFGKGKALFSLTTNDRLLPKMTRMTSLWFKAKGQKAADVNCRRNATRRILQWNSLAPLAKQTDNAKKHSQITGRLS